MDRKFLEWKTLTITQVFPFVVFWMFPLSAFKIMTEKKPVPIDNRN